MPVVTIGILFGCFGRTIDGDSWFTWWFFLIYQGNPSISPRRTPMGVTCRAVPLFHNGKIPAMHLVPLAFLNARKYHGVHKRCLSAVATRAIPEVPLRESSKRWARQRLCASFFFLGAHFFMSLFTLLRRLRPGTAWAASGNLLGRA